MPNILNLTAESGANFIGDDAQPSLTIANSSTGPGLKVDRFVVTSGASISQLNLNPGILAANATVGIAIQIPTKVGIEYRTSSLWPFTKYILLSSCAIYIWFPEAHDAPVILV